MRISRFSFLATFQQSKYYCRQRAATGRLSPSVRQRQWQHPGPPRASATCESGNRRVVRTELDGRQTVLADSYEGKRLNSPNDIVVRSDDSIWFTDPDYGILSDYTGNRASSELGRRCVFRLDPLDGKLAIATDKLDKPNGLAFSPTEKILFVADSGATHTPGWRT
ncbi:SMP-30/gluconolactonase/LRE family protein [Mesorhizobium sp. SEMIA396]|nr:MULTISPECIES: SMP-30/gluconolactonase/LRE family protein [unclassified Mesorhizobium]MCQ8812306.1 SMP-30/gluconolactonase/LRE family protein [Mesorhizobium sp. SEMIA396]